MPFMIVSRAAWTKYRNLELRYRLHLPVVKVIFTFTNKDYSNPWNKPSPGPRPNYNECLKELNYLLKGDLGMCTDIRYNFLLGTNGTVFEGRGWFESPVFPATYKHLRRNGLLVAFLGDFSKESPPKELFELRDEFLRFGVRNRFIRPTFLSITRTPPKAKGRVPDINYIL